jgi:hypothetical protein
LTLLRSPQATPSSKPAQTEGISEAVSLVASVPTAIVRFRTRATRSRPTHQKSIRIPQRHLVARNRKLPHYQNVLAIHRVKRPRQLNGRTDRQSLPQLSRNIRPQRRIEVPQRPVGKQAVAPLAEHHLPNRPQYRNLFGRRVSRRRSPTPTRTRPLGPGVRTSAANFTRQHKAQQETGEPNSHPGHSFPVF